MYMDEEGRKLTQATAILQYLAAIHGVVASDPLEIYENTWYFETEHDAKSKNGQGTAIFKADATDEEIETTVRLKGEFLELLDKRWSDGREHVTGQELTSADFAVLSYYTSCVVNPGLRVPAVREGLTAKVESLPHYMRVVNNIKTLCQSAVDALEPSFT